MPFALLLHVIDLCLTGTRARVAAAASLEDLPSQREVLTYDEESDKLDELIVDERDRTLINRVDELLRVHANGTKIIGVLYGATHMRALVRHLTDKRGYQVMSAE